MIDFNQMLDAGVHFGHLRRKWNPKMAPYIYMERNGIHIIDLHKTAAKVEEASAALKQIAKSGKTTLQEILQTATNVQISEGTNGSSSSIVKMRGSAGDNPFSQVVILFNGRRLNNPDMTPQNLLSIPVSQIDRIPTGEQPDLVTWPRNPTQA